MVVSRGYFRVHDADPLESNAGLGSERTGVTRDGRKIDYRYVFGNREIRRRE